jgi:hypothetical protein
MSHGAPKATHWGRQGSALREGTDTGCYRFWCEGVHHGRTPSKTSAFAPNCGAQAPPQNWPNEGPEIWFDRDKNFRQENFHQEICREAIAKALVAARDAGKRCARSQTRGFQTDRSEEDRGFAQALRGAQFAPQDRRLSIRALDADVLYQPRRQDVAEITARAIAAREGRVEVSVRPRLKQGCGASATSIAACGARLPRLRCCTRSPSGHRALAIARKAGQFCDETSGLFPRCGIRFVEENTLPDNFARILIAKPLSTGAETALHPPHHGKTTCSTNQPRNPPPAPPARWPGFVLSNLPASDPAPSHA